LGRRGHFYLVSDDDEEGSGQQPIGGRVVMATVPNFDDFLDVQPKGPALDTLAAKFGLTRNAQETDQALLTRIKTAAGYTGAGTFALVR
jgi:hypothetical protein